jgi:hypothetical protein
MLRDIAFSSKLLDQESSPPSGKIVAGGSNDHTSGNILYENPVLMPPNVEPWWQRS